MRLTSDHPAHQPGLDQGWFYHQGGGEHGPRSRESLAEALRLMPTIGILVWHASLPDWASPAEPQIRALIHGASLPPERPRGLLALLFSFDGRIGRARYFWTYCLGIIPYLVSVMAALLYMRVPIDSETGVLIRLALVPPFLWIGLALTAKRLHDFDMSATHLVWVAPALVAGSVVPPRALGSTLLVVSGAVELWLLLKQGTSGPNRYGRSSLTTSAMTMITPPGKRKGGWNVWTGVVVLGCVILAFFAVRTMNFPSLDGLGGLSCSSPSVLSATKSAIINDPSEIFNIMMIGGKDNIRMSFTDVRTQDYNSPLNGFTCVALFTSGPINMDLAATKSTGSLDVVFDVQRTDANDGRFVVHILSHGLE